VPLEERVHLRVVDRVAPDARQCDLLTSGLRRSSPVIGRCLLSDAKTTKPELRPGFRLVQRRGRDLNPRRA
jgi:hypothetical protein